MGFASSKRGRCRARTVNTKILMSVIVVGVLLFIINIGLMVIDPILIIAKYSTRVVYGSYIHEALARESTGVQLAAYLFNITNAEQFQAGLDHKLKVKEVGPFTYQEFRRNEQLELDFDNNVIRYIPRVRTEFLPAESVGLPKDINVTMPNIAMLSMASKVSSYNFVARMGYNLLTNQLSSKSIVRMTAKDYLWGYNEPLIKLGNTIMPGFVDFDVLGVLDRLYDKKATHLLELSSKTEDKFAIKTVNGSKGLDKWGYKNTKKRSICNTFTNTYEGISYPPEMTGDRPIRIYRTILCRFLELDYHGTTMTRYGIEALKYKISNRTYQKNEETECLCDEGICVEGVSDLSPCFLGLPIVLSNAHFMHADPKLYERIEGIQADEKRHGSSFVIEPKIGIVLGTQFSIQVNILVRDVRFNTEASRFSDMIVPVAYFTVKQPPLLPIQTYYLNLIYFIGPKILLSIHIILGILALGLLGYAARLLYWKYWFPKKKEIVLHPIVRGKLSEEPLMR